MRMTEALVVLMRTDGVGVRMRVPEMRGGIHLEPFNVTRALRYRQNPYAHGWDWTPTLRELCSFEWFVEDFTPCQP